MALANDTPQRGLAPVNFLAFSGEKLYVLVGKSDNLREVIMSDTQRLRLMKDLSAWAARRFEGDAK